MKRKIVRKEALRQRMYAYAIAHKLDDGTMEEKLACAFRDGYKACMRDGRQALNESSSHTESYDNVVRFLGPIR